MNDQPNPGAGSIEATDEVDPRIPSALRPPDSPTSESVSAAIGWDPLRYCIFTTIALLCWWIWPPVVVLAMSTLALTAYVRAWRGGLRRSRCVLGDVRLVVAYLAIAWIGSATWIVFRITGVWS